MKLMSLVVYYLLVTSGLFLACVQYANDHVSKACFLLIGTGILLVLNEVKRNARITTNYYHCEFISPAIQATPQPGPAAPGPEKEGKVNGSGTKSQ